MHVLVHVDGSVYKFDQDQMTNLDAIALERHTGWGLATWEQKLNDSSGLAITFLVWLVRSREEPDLDFADVTFNLSRFDIEQIPDTEDEPGKDQAPSGLESIPA